MRQTDLFAAARAPGPPPSDLPDPAAIRVRLHDMLTTARASKLLPWTPERTRVQQLIFHGMVNWLPEDERDALWRDFAAEMVRPLGLTPSS